ncbi:MAG: M48 family metalloprotease, partial [Gemmatimonadales bacterium]|nr:M48 family metalloprotease [Gemmatimonadales bacterium]
MFRVFGLMLGLTVLLVFAGQIMFGQQGAVLFLVLSGAMNFGMYWFSDRVVLRMYRAQVVDRSQAPDLYDRVERLRKRAGLPAPVVAISPQPQPNAFATGRNPEHAVVCFTQGILRALPARELDGVIAHELAHIKHRHMLVGTVAATMAGAIAMIASIARWGFIFGGGRDDGDNPLGMLVMAIVAPLAAVIIQMAISRRNEFQADRTGGEITGDPMGLAGALKRL